LPTLEYHVSSFQKLKDEAQKDFKKVKRQVESCLMLVAVGEAKLSQLQLKFDAHILIVVNLQS
jgi:hypothetical protein